MTSCNFCKKEIPKKSLMRHIGQSKSCKEKYGKNFDDMKADRKRKNNSDYYIKNAEKLNEAHPNYDYQHKEAISQWKKTHYSQNAQELKEKKAKYDNELKDQLKEKKTNYNNKHKEEIKEKQKVYRTKQEMNMTSEDRIKAFKKDIVEGPNFTCFSCKRCQFKKSVRIIKSKDVPAILAKLDPKFLQRIGMKKNRLKKNPWQVDLIACHNCLKLIRKDKVPKIHHSNGLWLDKVSEELELKDLEQQLIARTLLFMKVKKLPTTRMKAMFDQVISVPIEQDDVSRTVSELPRHPDDARIVAVKLKRKLEYKNTHIQEFIRPSKCIKAVEKLKEMGNPFYQDINVNVAFMEREDVSFEKIGCYFSSCEITRQLIFSFLLFRQRKQSIKF